MSENLLCSTDILQYAIENGMLDLSSIQSKIKMKRRKELLEEHPYRIWQGKNGRWYTYLPDEEKGRIQKERLTKEDIENVVVDYWKQQEEDPTVKEVFDEWNDRRLSLKKISQPTHLRNEQIFNRHYKGKIDKVKIRNITEDFITDFLESEIADKELTAKAFSSLKSITKGFLKRAKKRKFISFNVEETLADMDITDSSFKKVIKKDYQEVFSEEETEDTISYLIKNLDTQNIAILLMFVTGIRVGELVALKHEDFTADTVTIRRMERRQLVSKGKYEYIIKESPKTEAGIRIISIPFDYLWLVDRIQKLNPFGEFVFTNDKGERLTTNSIRRREERNCKKLNIYQKSPNKIRKTYGTILLDNNIDKQIIKDFMGHTDISVTENHYHRNRKSQEKKQQIISSLPDFKRITTA